MALGSWEAGADWAIEVINVTKKYGPSVVLDGLTMRVPRGGVHGLLGANGSGKTTLIRVLLGLVRAQEGSISVLNHQIPQQLPKVIGQVGAVVESPKFSPRMSGRQNLLVLADSIGVPRRRVTEVLLEVKLADKADRSFESYSLGMKQRLAIAATLLKQPEILIFDEPTNGLDPEGIRDIRSTLRGLGEAGRTVLVSSHMLSEVEQVADSVSIIAKGKVIIEGTLRELLDLQDCSVFVGTNDPVEAAQVLVSAGWSVTKDIGGLHVRKGRNGEADAQTIVKTLGAAGIWPHELSTRRSCLEDVFLELTRSHHFEREGN